MRENVLMCALFGELSIAECVLKYRTVNALRQARELGVFAFVAGDLRSCEREKGKVDVSALKQ